jgi:hypothetical protein
MKNPSLEDICRLVIEETLRLMHTKGSLPHPHTLIIL